MPAIGPGQIELHYLTHRYRGQARLPQGSSLCSEHPFQAGSEAYVQAANGFLADQLLFGSSYTFRPIGQSIEDAQKLGFKDEVVEKFFYRNAARILNLA